MVACFIVITVFHVYNMFFIFRNIQGSEIDTSSTYQKLSIYIYTIMLSNFIFRVFIIAPESPC